MRMRASVVGGLFLLLAGTFSAGYTVRDLATGITEAPSHWWSTAPWVGIVVGLVLLVLARTSRRRSKASMSGVEERPDD